MLVAREAVVLVNGNDNWEACGVTGFDGTLETDGTLRSENLNVEIILLAEAPNVIVDARIRIAKLVVYGLIQ